MTTILLAEDQSIVAMALSMGLKNLGYNVLKPVSSGKDLIKEALEKQPEIIITDIHLKDKISGLDAIQILRPSIESIFIVMTGYSDAHTLTLVKEVNPDGFLLKPVNSSQIKDAIDTHFVNAEKRRAL